jgi:hypothetical protein
VEGIAGVASYLGAQKQLGRPRLGLSVKGQSNIGSFNFRAGETDMRYFLVDQEYWQCIESHTTVLVLYASACTEQQKLRGHADILP